MEPPVHVGVRVTEGYFITLEGGEGTGKSTQAARLGEALAAMGHDVLRTREPGGSPLAERIRGMLLTGMFKSSGPEVEAVMFAAARSDHLHRTILPALARGSIVICDRFFDSTRVYQAISGADPKLLDVLRNEATGGRSPDLTIVLDVDEAVAATRATARRGTDVADRFESEGMEFHRRVRWGFLEVAAAEPERCKVVSAEGTPDEVATRLVDLVVKSLAVGPGLTSGRS